MHIDPIVAARALGIDTPGSEWRHGRPGECTDAAECEDAIEHAVRTLAVERYPLIVHDEPECGHGCRERSCRDCERAGCTAGIHYDEFHDGGTDGCPPAATRHVMAGAFVRSLASGGGFVYGVASDPDGTADRLPTQLRPHEDYPDAPLYGCVERIIGAFLGASDTRDPDPPSCERDEATAKTAIQLAIALFCDPRPVAEIVCEALSDMAFRARSIRPDTVNRTFARMRRMAEVVAPRPVRAPETRTA